MMTSVDNDLEKELEYTWIDKIQYTKAGRFVRRHWLTLGFVFGFLTDIWLLDRVDSLFDNVILLFYILLAFGSMICLYMGVAEKVNEKLAFYFRIFSPLLIQYSFGGLLSSVFIYYGRSGDWLVSWPLLFFFGVIMIINELVKDKAGRLVYHLVTLFVGIFSYVVLIVPVFIGIMGPTVFVISGILALILMLGFIKLLTLIIPRFMKLQMRLVLFSIGSVFVTFNVLYFTNIIPPIPISLQEIGVYHMVERDSSSGTYNLLYEDRSWWQFWLTTSNRFSASNGGALYCFTNIYAPTTIETDIQHRWEYKNDSGVWVEHARISYPIRAVGVRGYRGFTLIQNYRDGQWRCSVETSRGQVLGRKNFIVDTSVVPVDLEFRVD